jgi:hypothetical protein
MHRMPFTNKRLILISNQLKAEREGGSLDRAALPVASAPPLQSVTRTSVQIQEFSSRSRAGDR